MTWYHGTTASIAQQALKSGLRRNADTGNGVFVTDTLSAALDYARDKAARAGDEPAVLVVELPELTFQPNGSASPPFYFDDWHRDSFEDGSKAYEFDREVQYSALSLLDLSDIKL